MHISVPPGGLCGMQTYTTLLHILQETLVRVGRSIEKVVLRERAILSLFAAVLQPPHLLGLACVMAGIVVLNEPRCDVVNDG